jgi:predicted signal transduction protein with EAL and GGDEF domain
LLKNANIALLGAKSDGRGTYRFFEWELDQRMSARRNLELDLRKALSNDELEIHYQPLGNLENSQIEAFEALLRWNHPVRGLVPLDDFIPVAEETGLMIQIGEWVLATACKEAVNWPEHIKVAVNLYPVQLKDRKLLDAVKSALVSSGLKASRLQIEITEAILMQNTFARLVMLHELRKLGVQIAMDNSAGGYSSFSYLHSFPFDKIKIDQSLITEIANAAEPSAIKKGRARFTNCSDIRSAVKGTDIRVQKDILPNMGGAEMQGYLFSKAKPASELGEFFASPKAMVASGAA